MKAVHWIGASKRKVKDFPDLAREEAGHQLWQVQCGKDPDDWKPMLAIGKGAREIRIHQPNEHRVIYVAQFPEAIYVLNAFTKKTQQTPHIDIEIARNAYAKIKDIRKNQ